MPDLINPIEVSAEEGELFDEIVVKITRTTKVVSGGKRMKFSALVAIGNKNGKVGFGYAKAPEVPYAVMKAIKRARKNVIIVPLAKNHTLPHSVTYKQTSSRVVLLPASEGTGLKAGYAVRALLSLAGIKDALSKVMGSTNTSNVVKATFEALRRLKSVGHSERLRGVRMFTPTLMPYTEPKKEGKAAAAASSSSKPAAEVVDAAEIFEDFKAAISGKLALGNDTVYTLREGKKFSLSSDGNEVILKTDEGRVLSISHEQWLEIIEALAKESVSNIVSKPFHTMSVEDSELAASVLVDVLPKRFKAINKGFGIALI